MTGGQSGRPAARRVRVTHPRTDATRRLPMRPTVREIDEQTQLGEVYMTSLVRSQRRLAVVVCAFITLLMGGIALLGALAPWFGRARVLGISVPWLVLGVLIYPALIGLGMYALRHAERNERDFTDLVHRQ